MKENRVPGADLENSPALVVALSADLLGVFFFIVASFIVFKSHIQMFGNFDTQRFRMFFQYSIIAS